HESHAPIGGDADHDVTFAGGLAEHRRRGPVGREAEHLPRAQVDDQLARRREGRFHHVAVEGHAAEGVDRGHRGGPDRLQAQPPAGDGEQARAVGVEAQGRRRGRVRLDHAGLRALQRLVGGLGPAPRAQRGGNLAQQHGGGGGVVQRADRGPKAALGLAALVGPDGRHPAEHPAQDHHQQRGGDGPAPAAGRGGGGDRGGRRGRGRGLHEGEQAPPAVDQPVGGERELRARRAGQQLQQPPLHAELDHPPRRGARRS
ncbi:MAG: hypothetical protein ACK559_15610, partial [bacterium]